jgi:hypothetical protein
MKNCDVQNYYTIANDHKKSKQHHFMSDGAQVGYGECDQPCFKIILIIKNPRSVVLGLS